MTDQSSAPNAASTETESKAPTFRIQRIYLKDLSLEQPNAPEVFLVVAEPQVEVEVDVAEGVDEMRAVGLLLLGPRRTKCGLFLWPSGARLGLGPGHLRSEWITQMTWMIRARYWQLPQA